MSEITGPVDAIEARTRKIQEATGLQEMMASMQDLQRQLGKQNSKKHDAAVTKSIVRKLQTDGFPMFQVDAAGNIVITERAAHTNTKAKSSAEGIDVSSYQGSIDWKKAKNEIDFAMIKLSEGSTIADANFEKNWKQTNSCGIMRGAYHFFRPKTSIKEQIDNFCAPFDHHYNGDLPPALDLEDAHLWSGIPLKERISRISAWMKGVEHELGVRPIIYTNTNFYEKVLHNSPALKKYPLWIADWRERETPGIPGPWKEQKRDYLFWQYDAFGKVNGVSGRIDRDYFKGSMTELRNVIVEQKQAAAVESQQVAGKHPPGPAHRHKHKHPLP